ncbi:MAG: outer membrane lipoprotein-sorting protein [Verrucomicrobiota bacterium]
MKNPFVHARVPGENRSSVLVKQATLLLALQLLGGGVRAESLPDAQQVLANVRLRQSTQQLDLPGQLRQESALIPFRLVQNGPVIRYIFTNPDETLLLRLGENDSRLKEITRSGSTNMTRGKLDDAVRGTAITYEDLAFGFLYWPNARVVGSDFLRTRSCWKLQLQSPSNESQYGRMDLWVDKEGGALMRMEGFDRSGKLKRRFEVVSAQKIDDRWFLKQMRVEMKDPGNGAVTRRTYLEIKK